MDLTARVPALLRERTFRRYWTGQTVSLVGDQISLMALPLTAVLVLGADAAQMGWLKTLELLPALLLNLPFGAWVDRRANRRQIMIATDLGRAALLITLPVAYAFDLLKLGQLYAVALAVGALSVLFEACNSTLFAALVPTERYVQANSLVNGSRSTAWLAGPGIGGVLVQVLTAPVALLADALTYLVSAGYLAKVPADEPAPAPVAKGHFTEGMRWMVREPSMRALFAASGTVQFFNYMFHTLFVLYVTKDLGLSAGLLGLVLGTGAVGGLLGALCSGAVVRRLGIGGSIVAGFLGFTLPLVLIPAAHGPLPLVVVVLFAAEFLSCVGVMIVDVAAGSFQLALIPDALRARVMGAYRTLNHGFRPLGALAGGVLGTVIGLRPTLWVATVGAVFAVLWLLPSPLPRMRELPTQEREPTVPVG
ncbi:MFS transporter [Streptomyces sp. CC208A]|uniref:MFS transporter n=1 Tax=Streptomyces sp. CC208A TaxID=3044573 RepID=UPI0024A7DE72|nr:MFS transporter [Streptomyces sp. CC208A]